MPTVRSVGEDHDEEVQLLEAAAAPDARTSGLRVKALVAVGLGVAAAAGCALYAQGAPAAPLAPARASLVGLQGKAESETPAAALGIEQNLGDFVTDLPAGAEPGGRLGASLGDASLALFQHVVEKAGIEKELTTNELEAFKFRFLAAMMETQDTNRPGDYLSHAKKRIEGSKPVMTESLAAALNTREHAYKVEMRPWLLDESMDSFNSRLIKVSYESTLQPWHQAMRFTKSFPEEPLLGAQAQEPLPVEFKSAEKWGNCMEVIENPHNQGRCGSCWAFGGTGALDSRLCIHTKGKFSGQHAMLSRGFGTSCAVDYDGCQGGWPHLIYDYIKANEGIPTEGCDPYFAGTDYADHWSSAMPSPKCPSSCDKRFPRSMSHDLFKPMGVWNYKLVDTPDEVGMEQMKRAIFEEGPVPYALYADSAFMGFSSGVFDGGCGHQANHAVQAIGWGKMMTGWGPWKKEREYIQSLNSWGTHWGLNGQFNIVYCGVWHYVKPGRIHGQHYPLPVPAAKGEQEA